MRLRVPVRRLSMIRRLASSVQRWLIFSPSRLITPSTFSKAALGGRSRVGSQACQMTLGFVLRARCGSRERPTTVWPRASKESHNAEPMKPLAPVTRTRTELADLHRGEGAGLLAESGQTLALGLLDHGFGHHRCHLAVEDAGDDVVLGKIVLGDHFSDPASCRQLHLLGDVGGAGVEGTEEM